MCYYPSDRIDLALSSLVCFFIIDEINLPGYLILRGLCDFDRITLVPRAGIVIDVYSISEMSLLKSRNNVGGMDDVEVGPESFSTYAPIYANCARSMHGADVPCLKSYDLI